MELGTSYNSVLVRCPFYQSDDALRIKCEGLDGSSRLAVEFSNKAEKLQWMKNYCNSAYGECKVCQIIDKEYQ